MIPPVSSTDRRSLPERLESVCDETLRLKDVWSHLDKGEGYSEVTHETWVQLVKEALDAKKDVEIKLKRLQEISISLQKPEATFLAVEHIVSLMEGGDISGKLEVVSSYKKLFKPSEDQISSLICSLFDKANCTEDIIPFVTDDFKSVIPIGDRYDVKMASLFQQNNEFFQKSIAASSLWWGKVIVHNLRRISHIDQNFTRKRSGSIVKLRTQATTVQLLRFLTLLHLKTPDSLRKIFIDTIFEVSGETLLFEKGSFIIVTPK